MHKDTIKGAAKEMGGKVKKHAGDAMDDPEMEADGALTETEGKVQKTFGKVKQSARDALKH